MLTLHYKSKSSIAIFLIAIGIVFLNFTPVRPLNYPLTIAPLILLFITPLALSIKKGLSRYLLPWITVIIFVLLKSTFDLFNITGSEIQFFKTFLLWAFYWTFFLAFLVFPIRNKINLSRLSLLYSSLFILIASICAAQLIYYKITGNINIFNLWGEYNYASQGYVTKVIEFGAMKTTGFYFEPAFCALVMYALLTARQISAKISYIYYPLVLIAFYITGSFSGVLCALFALLTTTLFPDHTSNKNKGIKLIIGTFVFMSAFYFLADLIATRSLQVFDASTSTYYRLIAPLEIIKSVLTEHPFGMLLGVMESDIVKHSLSNGASIGKTIDNGWYLLFYYFGWIGVFIFASYLIIGFKLALKLRNGSIEAYQFLLLSPFFTGAVFSPEFLLLQAIVIFTFKQRQAQ
ncbi:hypothetical protein AA303_20450 [Pseudomonas psychrophila]|uniref:hypothetical protein n=1 Tax=Pseudomonas psychrophila TaxID=122355 RepID=UPI000629DEDD|nr:hypothetical protein [Pseudomonas psychrophila]KOX63234.1 hypothetical protein AA303_20450 [Pseudomonas psychrophila]